MRINVNTTFILKYIFLIIFEKALHTANLRFSNGSAIKNIPPLSDLKNINVLLPCLEEQTKIADFLSAFDRKLDNQKAQLEHWQQIKKGLLQQMFV